jgi:hypothetical protein
MKQTLFTVGIITLTLFLAVRCGSSDPAATTNPFSVVAPSLGVSSPTSTGSATVASLKRNNGVVTAAMSLPFIRTLVGLFLSNEKKSLAAEDTERPTDFKRPDQMAVENESDFKQSPDVVAAKIGNLGIINKFRAQCFGFGYSLNLNNAGTATGSTRAVLGGDAGILYSTASDTDTRPCSVAEVDALIASQPGVFNKVFKMIIAMLAKANAEGETLPAIGETVTVTMPTVTSATFTKATLERLADGTDGFAVYKIVIQGTIGGKTLDVLLLHSPHDATNTNYAGFGRAVLPYTSTFGGGEARGLSIVYSVESGVNTLMVDSCANRATTSTDFFNSTTGRVDFSKGACGEEIHKMISTYDKSTHAGTLHYAWQAGGTDGAARIFEATTDGTNGRAFVGFGAAIASITDSTSTPWGTKFHCNWTNGTAMSPSVTKVQKQTFSLSSTTGEYTVAVDNIAYHASDSCDSSVSYTVSSAPTFFGTSKSASTNVLVNASTNDIPSITAITAYPTP